jgi:hypothetical protein
VIAGALLLPFSFSADLQTRGSPNGQWVVGAGVGFGPVALSMVAADAVAPFMALHVFGRKLLQIPLQRWVSQGRAGAFGKASRVRLTGFERGVGRYAKALDPVEVVIALWKSRGCFGVRSLLVDLEYSFRDVALTGRLLGAIYMLAGLLPQQVRVTQSPHWDAQDRWGLVADGQFRLWPGRLLLSGLEFMLKQRSAAKRLATGQNAST